MNSGRARAAFVLSFCAAIVSGACGRTSVVTRPVTPPPAFALHDEYAESLRETGTDRTPLGQQWFMAADLALASPIDVSLPFRETGLFSSTEALAEGYRFTLGRSQRLVVDVLGTTSGGPPLFLDLFELSHGSLRKVAPINIGAERLSLIAERGGEFVLRIQPRFATARRYTLILRTGTGLTFPVAGVLPEKVADDFGASRDSGQRVHEGVDIFAPRGTPALAAADGVITRTHDGGLGGRAVWLRDPALDLTYYYAHLDRWTVKVGQQVSAGETIGLVGNTGNAASGPPHLHFGVFKADGQAVNPMPYLAETPASPPATTADAGALGHRLRTRAARARLAAEPDGQSGRASELAPGTIIWVDAATAETYRVRLPDGTAGFVLASATEAVTDPVRAMAVGGPTAILDSPLPSAGIVARVDRGASLSVLGVFESYLFVRTREGQEGWIRGSR